MNIESILFRLLYRYISLIDRKKEVIFMNYGYHDDNESIELHSSDEVNRYSIQLYHRLAKMVDLKGKDIIEVGSGRGGGISYVTRTFEPASAIGIDLDERATSFGNKHHKVKGLSFKQGDAQNLQIIASNSIDVVFNVESSHRYPDITKFYDEVYRVLKPGGQFLYTDFRTAAEMEDLLHKLSKYDYIKFDEQLITKNVLKALDLDYERRLKLINRLAPPFIKKHIHDFSGGVGSPTYNRFKTQTWEYFVFCFQKPV